MMTKIAGAALMTLLLAGIPVSVAVAADPAPAREQAQEPVYGSQLMTEEERMAHRRTMRSLKTEEERNAFRAEHHRQMQERAKERGVTLPDAPPPRGMGMGPGPGGMGPGPGGGPGMGRGMGPGGPGGPGR